ncbi:hypothetical protein C9374_003524 [Naegleria lovaniensis]|uniref:Uncharacterized protein n=1 Tax=Naegleria lovaniensis TaxID=51637 RepID=A0AA88GT88_NAELO|nr:uncharacterized protein C9374_003524 [Naegleria lovaniensis]KAG2385709.1 hypothetical protein C9374_003524 [Naegleria lovaniensis]
MIQILLKHSHERGYERVEFYLRAIQNFTFPMMMENSNPDHHPPTMNESKTSNNSTSLLISKFLSNNNTQCHQELVKHIIALNYASEFYSSLLSNAASQTEHEQKASRIVQDLTAEYSNSTSDKCGNNHTIPLWSLGIQLKSREELISKREQFLMSSELIEKIENVIEDEVNSNSDTEPYCAKTMVEVLIAREVLISISKAYAIPGVEKGVNFYLSLKLRAHCSRSSSLIKKSHNMLKEYPQISEEITNDLYSLFKVSEKLETINSITPQGKNILLKLSNDRLTNNKIEEQLQDIANLNMQIEQLKHQNEMQMASALETESSLKITILSKNEEITLLNKQLLDKEVKISNHKEKISELEEKVHSLNETVESNKITNSILLKNLTLLEDYLQTLNITTISIIEKKDQQIKEMLLVKTMQEDTITKLQNDLKIEEQRKVSQQNALQEEIKKQADLIEGLQKEITHLKHEKSEQFEQIETLKQTTLRVVMTEKEEIQKHSAQLQQTAQYIAQISNYMGQFNETINEENEKIKGQLKVFLDQLEKKQQCQKTTRELTKKLHHVELEQRECFSALSLCREERTKIIQDKQVEKLILKLTSLEKRIEFLSNEKQELILRVGECSSNVTELEKLFKECSDKSTTLSSILIETKLEHVEEEKICKNNVEQLEFKLNETLTEMNKILSQNSDENSNLVQEISNLTSHLQECQLTTQQLTTQNSNLTLTLQELTLSFQELEKQNLELASAHARKLILEEDSDISSQIHSPESVDPQVHSKEPEIVVPESSHHTTNEDPIIHEDHEGDNLTITKKEEELQSSTATNETHEESDSVTSTPTPTLEESSPQNNP